MILCVYYVDSIILEGDYVVCYALYAFLFFVARVPNNNSKRPRYVGCALGQYPFCSFCFVFSALFFGQFCSGICYFSVFLLPILLRFGGSNMLQRGDYAHEICYFVVVHASPLPLQPVYIIYFSFSSYLFWP